MAEQPLMKEKKEEKKNKGGNGYKRRLYHQKLKQEGLDENGKPLSATLKPTVPGLCYRPNFITEEEEQGIWNWINDQEWCLDLKRRTQQYGWKFQHEGQKLSQFIGPLPDVFQFLIDRMIEQGQLSGTGPRPDQMIINEYEPGQGIHPHIDKTHCFEEHVSSISLGSGATVVFRRKGTEKEAEEGVDQGEEERSSLRQDVYMPRRCLLVLTGDARYKWTHGIEPTGWDVVEGKSMKRKKRISITFRVVKHRE